jgi:hypothetical protein
MKCGHRANLIKEMAERLVNEVPDYKKSVISKQYDNVEKIWKPYRKQMISRMEIEQEQLKLKGEQIRRMKIDIDRGVYGDGVEATKKYTQEFNTFHRQVT